MTLHASCQNFELKSDGRKCSLNIKKFQYLQFFKLMCSILTLEEAGWNQTTNYISKVRASSDSLLCSDVSSFSVLIDNMYKIYMGTIFNIKLKKDW